MKNYITKDCTLKDNENDIDKPLIISNSFYENFSNNATNDDQLTVWKLENSNPNDECNPNTHCENKTLDDKSLNNEQCPCTSIWQKLTKVFEYPDWELKNIHSVKSTFLEDAFYKMPIDLNKDDCGETLEEFRLDGDYLESSDLNVNVPDEEVKESEKNEPVIDEPKEQPTNKPNVVPINNDNENKRIQNKNEKSNEATDISKLKTVDDVCSRDKIKMAKKKRTLKAPKRVKKCGLKILPCKRLGFKNELEQKENNMTYVYTYGESYRGGINQGHKKCVDFGIRIPPNKGWISDTLIEQQREKVGRMRAECRRLQQEGDIRPNSGANLHDAYRDNRENRERERLRSVTGDVGGGEAKRPSSLASQQPVEALPVLRLVKDRMGAFTITMAEVPAAAGGRAAEEPVVFRLANARARGPPQSSCSYDEDAASGCSSYDLEFVPPGAIGALGKKLERRHAATEYDATDFMTAETRRMVLANKKMAEAAEQKARQSAAEDRQRPKKQPLPGPTSAAGRQNRKQQARPASKQQRTIKP